MRIHTQTYTHIHTHCVPLNLDSNILWLTRVGQPAPAIVEKMATAGA